MASWQICIFFTAKPPQPSWQSDDKEKASGVGFVLKTGKIFCARTRASSPPLLLFLLLYLFSPRSNLLTSRLRLGTTLAASANQNQCYGHVAADRPMGGGLAE